MVVVYVNDPITPARYPFPKKSNSFIQRLRLPHNRRSPLPVPLDPTPHPLHRLPHTRPLQRAHRQNPTVPHPAPLLALEHAAHEPLLDAHRLNAVFAVLLVGQHQDRHPCRGRRRQHGFEDQPALGKSAGVRVCHCHAVGAFDSSACSGRGFARDVFVRRSAIELRRFEFPVPDVAAIDDEHDGVTTGVVSRPEIPQRVLAAHVPELEVHIG